MNTLNKILKLCKMSGCELSEDIYGRFTVYTPYRKVIVAYTDLNEALHCLRFYLRTRRIIENISII